jgi:hypothetical protein
MTCIILLFRGSTADENALRPNSLQLEINLTLEIAQLLLSLLHAWGLDRKRNYSPYIHLDRMLLPSHSMAIICTYLLKKIYIIENFALI